MAIVRYLGDANVHLLAHINVHVHTHRCDANTPPHTHTHVLLELAVLVAELAALLMDFSRCGFGLV